MYDSNILIKTESFTIDLELNSLVNVISGNSSTGKTFLIKMLDVLNEVNSSNIQESTIDINDIVICSKKKDVDMLLKLQNEYVNKTIFIDKYDIFQSEELKKFILSGKNRIVIMSHTYYDELELNTESFLVLKYDSNSRTFTTEKMLEHLHEEII